jgi:hypothetical protein
MGYKVLKMKKKGMRWPGIEPGSTAWKATMLTITPPSHLLLYSFEIQIQYALLSLLKIKTVFNT